VSVELHIFLEPSRLPTRDRWQHELQRAGIPLVLQPPFNPQLDSGFCPATYRNAPAGFEYYAYSARDVAVLADNPHIVSHLGNRNLCATFRWGADLDGMSAALAAAATLAKLSDGIYYYPDDGIIYGADEALQATLQDLELA